MMSGRLRELRREQWAGQGVTKRAGVPAVSTRRAPAFQARFVPWGASWLASLVWGRP